MKSRSLPKDRSEKCSSYGRERQTPRQQQTQRLTTVLYSRLFHYILNLRLSRRMIALPPALRELFEKARHLRRWPCFQASQTSGSYTWFKANTPIPLSKHFATIKILENLAKAKIR